MAALMAMWITTGDLTSFILAVIYMVFRGALSGLAKQAAQPDLRSSDK